MDALSRRAVLGATAGAAGLVTICAVDADAAVLGRTASAPLRSHYAGSVGRVFTARHGGRSVRMRLTAIRDVVPGSARQRSRCFVLVFAPVGRGMSAPDAIYDLRRHGVRTHRLFLSSFGTGRAMQAIINRPG
jgi:hypothetical protein